MIYNDSVYGKINIKEPVILELIESKPVVRLKKITQHGPSVYNKHYNKRIVTRFEHSLGVCVLLNKLGASLEEQIAGLLHDVGHAVFSHAIDFLYPEHCGEFDKKYHRELILNSEIPTILKKYKINLEKVLNENNFPILEKNLPNLCADRVDYFLRDPFLTNSFKKDFIIESLSIYNKELIFTKSKAAFYFSKQYLKMNHIFWARSLDEVLYFLMVDIFKIALGKNLISKKDFFLDEETFMKKIQDFKDKDIEEKLFLIKNLKVSDIKVSEKKIKNGYFIKSKYRIIDPAVQVGNNIKRLSEIDSGYQKIKDNFTKNLLRERWIGYNEI